MDMADEKGLLSVDHVRVIEAKNGSAYPAS